MIINIFMEVDRLSKQFSTPFFEVDRELLISNLEILKSVIDRTDCKILLAQKCFSMYETYPLISKYISGSTASGLYEAKLGREHMEGEVHVYCAGYRDDEIDEILDISDHIVFNSFSQWKHFKDKAIASKKSIGLRINPQCSTQEGHAIYDPCAPFSRMGITIDKFKGEDLEAISGLHFHTLCEQNSDDLVTTLEAVEEKFGDILYKMKWLNMGGGHHITRSDYDVDKLVETVNRIKNKYNVQVYLEPGEAVALNAGFLESSVLDIIDNDMNIAIIDASAACHMPDVLEMPYTPNIEGAKIVHDKEEQKKFEEEGLYVYRFGGPTCLAGDIIGDYAFEKPLKVGQRVRFCDMAIYSMVKTNTFNGMKLPSIVYKEEGEKRLIKTFGYQDFKQRL